MSQGREVLLLGTGLAPLLAASFLRRENIPVRILNPNEDFFLENSEISFDPLWGNDVELPLNRVTRSAPEHLLEKLGPHYPGPMEIGDTKFDGTQKPAHSLLIRVRSRTCLSSPWVRQGLSISDIEKLYLEYANLNPQIVSGITALNSFPGFKNRQEKEYQAVLFSRLGDVDVRQYRAGILEFLRERLEPTHLLSNVRHLEWSDSGIRTSTDRGSTTFDVGPVILLFYTPGIREWVKQISQFLNQNVDPLIRPDGVRSYDEWTLLSRDKIAPDRLGVFENFYLWANLDHAAGRGNMMTVLRKGHLHQGDRASTTLESQGIQELAEILSDEMDWSKATVRSYRPRTTFEWKKRPPNQILNWKGRRVFIVPESDGPIGEIAHRVADTIEQVFAIL